MTSGNASRREFLTGDFGGAEQQPRPDAGAKLQYRTLGKTGLKLTSVGFGCMVTSDSTVVEMSLDAGINYFDTARDYQNGNNEKMLGAAMKGKRDRVHISTKTAATEKADALKDLDDSLRTLGTDYVDIWMLHDRSRVSELTPPLIEALQEAKQQGKTRFTGVSVHRGHGEVIAAAVKSGRFDVIMTSYNFAMDHQKMDPVVHAAHEAGVGVIAMKVLAGSFRLDPATFDKARAVLKRPGAGLAALKWALRNPDIDVAVPGILDADQLQENMRAMSEPFEEPDAKMLAGYIDRFGPLYCRTCGHCEGSCSKGLPVSDMLRILSYADGYRQFPLARERYLELPDAARHARCTCAKCTVECRFGVRVAERLRKAQAILS
jgi:predicted aldo/keto reductase-like oxidoreductase